MTDDLIRGSGNVFRDLGEPDADRKHARAMFTAELIKRMDALGLDKRTLNDLRFVRVADLDRLTDDRLIELQHMLSGLEAKDND